MEMKAKVITTINREIYEKFNSLNILDEIILRNVKDFQVERILENINKDGKFLLLEKHDGFILVKKNGNIKFNVYLR
jgi:hypothetical protein